MPILTNGAALGVGFESAEKRMIAGTRLFLALAALLILWIDPVEPAHYFELTYAAVILYAAYSAALYLSIQSGNRIVHLFQRWSNWFDIGWFTLLIALSSGANSIFFMLFFFPIMIASFRGGLRMGLWMTIVGTMLFLLVGYITVRPHPEFALNRYLLRPVYLIAFGYMIAWRGGYEITLRRRLTLLKEINALSNPRFGIDRTIGSNLEALRRFYDADSCFIVTENRMEGGRFVRRALRSNPEAACRAVPLESELDRQLIIPPAGHAIVYASRARGIAGSSYYECDVRTGERVRESRQAAESMAAFLETRSFITVPYESRGENKGRLYLTSRNNVFRASDVDFLLQVIAQIEPVLDNIRLVDQLASRAAEEERRRIGYDIHDSFIQAYIGLQIGLSSVKDLIALAQFERSEEEQLKELLRSLEERIDKLGQMSGSAIVELRSFINRLKAGSNGEGNLLQAVKRFAVNFTEASGILTQVEANVPIEVNDRFAAEMFQMVVEGLSNIRRHTQATRAIVRLSSTTDRFVLRIEDEGDGGSKPAPFIPNSITERARWLQGSARVEPMERGSSVVVEIPR